MIKPDRLRALLTRTIADFNTNPDKLILQLDQGTIHATGAKSHSFEYHYTLEVMVTDFPYHPDVLIVPIIEFLRIEQSELLHNPDHRGNIKFELERNDNHSYDIYLSIPLTERVIVQEVQGEYSIQHGNEPQPIDQIPLEKLTLFIKGEKVYEHIATS